MFNDIQINNPFRCWGTVANLIPSTSALVAQWRLNIMEGGTTLLDFGRVLAGTEGSSISYFDTGWLFHTAIVEIDAEMTGLGQASNSIRIAALLQVRPE